MYVRKSSAMGIRHVFHLSDTIVYSRVLYILRGWKKATTFSVKKKKMSGGNYLFASEPEYTCFFPHSIEKRIFIFLLLTGSHGTRASGCSGQLHDTWPSPSQYGLRRFFLDCDARATIYGPVIGYHGWRGTGGFRTPRLK